MTRLIKVVVGSLGGKIRHLMCDGAEQLVELKCEGEVLSRLFNSVSTSTQLRIIYYSRVRA